MLLRVLLHIAACLTATALTGCAGVHLYDPSRDATAKLAVEQRDAAALGQVSKQTKKLLDELLAQESEAAQAAHDFLWENDLFRIAASDTSERDEHLTHWVNEIDERIEAIGFMNRHHVLKLADLGVEQKGEKKKFDKARQDIKLMVPELVASLPPCKPPLPEHWPDSNANIDDEMRAEIDALGLYAVYKSNCESYLQTSESIGKGALKSVYDLAAERRAAMADKKLKAKEVVQVINNLKEEIKNKTKPGTPPSIALREAIENLEKKIAKAQKLQEKLDVDVLSKSTLESIGFVLASLTSEVPDKPSVQNGEFHEALAFLSQIPSLEDDAAALAEQGKRPPVAHLVIELNRQLLIRNYLQRVESIDELGLKYAEDMAETLQAQANAYREFVNEICNYGFTKPGPKCDDLVVNPEGKKCDLGASSSPCLLSKTWAKALKDGGPKKRHLLAAVVALSNAHRAAARASELEFQINDLTYRKALLTSENAIAQWDNLIQIPVEQIAAFYDAGVKPEVLSDFITKVLAITGLVIAVESN